MDANFFEWIAQAVQTDANFFERIAQPFERMLIFWNGISARSNG